MVLLYQVSTSQDRGNSNACWMVDVEDILTRATSTVEVRTVALIIFRRLLAKGALRITPETDKNLNQGERSHDLYLE